MFPFRDYNLSIRIDRKRVIPRGLGLMEDVAGEKLKTAPIVNGVKNAGNPLEFGLAPPIMNRYAGNIESSCWQNDPHFGFWFFPNRLLIFFPNSYGFLVCRGMLRRASVSTSSPPSV